MKDSTRSASGSRLTRGTVLVAEDDAALRAGLVSVLRRAGFVTEGAETGEEALAVLTTDVFDVVLADINMPGNARLELLTKVQALGAAVVLMTGQPTVDSAVGALHGGAIDYITKPIAPDQLVLRLDAAVLKQRALGAARARPRGLNPDDLARLSQREKQVVELLTKGDTAKDVASKLGLSANTVRNHVKSIFAKLRVHSQIELLVKLRRGER
ncbi:MAG TPA: response regulator transcription factor [Polyangiaceae bacterium]|nr:response regulator transcription factor [Polyangiaceae bacterium]